MNIVILAAGDFPSHDIPLRAGLRDAPCMKMTRPKGRTSITIYAEGHHELGDNMLLQGRCDYCVPADYTEGSPIEQTVSLLLKRIAAVNACSALHARPVETATRRGGIPEWQLQLNRDNTDLES